VNWARLRTVTADELTVRGRQTAFKLIERATPARTARRSPAAFAPDPRRFFAGATAAATPSLVADRAPDHLAAVLAAADEACAGRVRLFGYGPVSFGDPIDWQLDPIAQVRAPLVHWSRLDVLDFGAVGDSKIAWELNRQQWLVWLGQAYRLTGEPRWCEAFVSSVRQWLRANPRPRGIAWASSLEVSLRLISWLWALFLVGDAPAVRGPFAAELLGAIADGAAHVERYLSWYYSPNTHLTGEGLGLLYAGLLLGDDPRATRWRELGARILTEQCERQIAPDGSYGEQSTCYQRYTAEIYLHALILADHNEVELPALLGQRLQALLDQLLWLRAPTGSLPAIGDADGGWLLPLSRRAPGDVRGLYSTAAAWFGRADYAHAAGGRVAPETLWLLGAAGAKAFDEAGVSPPDGSPSRLFADGGIAVLRSSWDQDAHRLLFDTGSLAGFGHAHADLLSVQCDAFGEPLIVDPGTYCYNADPGWREHFRSTAAHSTVTVDGLGQSESAGVFRWRERPRARLNRWRSTEAYDYADAEHDGFLRLPDPVRHRRRVLFVKPRHWVVVDDLRGAAAHRVELRFQFAPVRLELDAGGWARALGTHGHALLVRTFSAVALDLEVRRGGRCGAGGWVSRDYGHREPAPALVCTATACLPLRLVTLLIPLRDGAGTPPAVTVAADLSAIEFDDGERIVIGDELAPVTAGIVR
jgi:hypothetical protein